MIWLDAQLPPALAKWISQTFGEPCLPVRNLSLRDAPDWLIFQKAKEANVIVMTKDKDFVELLYRHQPPPKVIWLTCGNTSSERLKEILTLHLLVALEKLRAEDALVEIQ